MEKEILKRHIQDMLHKTQFAKERTEDLLPIIVYRHNSLIRRRLGNVNMQLQENKATNLALAVKHIPSRRDILRLETRWTDYQAEGVQGGTDHRQGQALTGYRRRHVPVVEPHPLARIAQRTDHHGASSPRWARSFPRLRPSDSLRHWHQHLVQLYRLSVSQRHPEHLSTPPLDE